VLVEIAGTDLPGRRCGPNPEGRWYENIHVGLGRAPKLTGLVPGDAPSAHAGRLGLTDGKGHPRYARVRPPDVAWSAQRSPQATARKAG
jgi:Family of unknown function (DUF5990)